MDTKQVLAKVKLKVVWIVQSIERLNPVHPLCHPHLTDKDLLFKDSNGSLRWNPVRRWIQYPIPIHPSLTYTHNTFTPSIHPSPRFQNYKAFQAASPSFSKRRIHLSSMKSPLSTSSTSGHWPNTWFHCDITRSSCARLLACFLAEMGGWSYLSRQGCL
jgi:hypothetical protein